MELVFLIFLLFSFFKQKKKKAKNCKVTNFWPQTDPRMTLRKKLVKNWNKMNSILFLQSTKCTFCESFSQIHWKMADICYFEDQKMAFEKKNAFKVTEKYVLLWSISYKICQKYTSGGWFRDFFSYYYKVNIWKGHLRLKLKNVKFSSRWPILGADFPVNETCIRVDTVIRYSISELRCRA